MMTRTRSSLLGTFALLALVLGFQLEARTQRAQVTDSGPMFVDAQTAQAGFDIPPSRAVYFWCPKQGVPVSKPTAIRRHDGDFYPFTGGEVANLVDGDPSDVWDLSRLVTFPYDGLVLRDESAYKVYVATPGVSASCDDGFVETATLPTTTNTDQTTTTIQADSNTQTNTGIPAGRCRSAADCPSGNRCMPGECAVCNPRIRECQPCYGYCKPIKIEPNGGSLDR